MPVPDARALLEPILALHDRIVRDVVAACERQDRDALTAANDDATGDTSYGVDAVAEHTLVEGLAAIADREPLWLVAEGLPAGGMALPRGTAEADCRWRVLVDPIDGTRGLMYQKRPAWVLTGVAPNRGTATRLADIALAVQTEIPLVKQHLADQLWALRGAGTHGVRRNRFTGETAPLTPHPSGTDTLAHGFASIARFFPGARDVLAAIDEDLMRTVLGPPVAGKAAAFEDQYLSTGGQLYELLMGHDRFIADLRPLMAPVLASRGLPQPLCCHPYDLCAMLVAQEAGVIVTDADGRPADAPFDRDADVAWVGYANDALRARVEPALQAALARHLDATR